MVHATRYTLYNLLGSCGRESWMAADELACGVADMDGVTNRQRPRRLLQRGYNITGRRKLLLP